MRALKYTPGRNDYTIMVEGQRREFIVDVPKSYVQGTSVPLVLVFHGSAQDGELFWQNSGWKEKGASENFLTVYPTALRYFVTDDDRTVTKWSAIDLPSITRPGTKIYDDVVFTRQMVALARQTWSIDPERIFATGFSNGGQFATTRLMMEAADVVASFAVSGSGVLTPGATISPSAETSRRSLYVVLGSKDDKILSAAAAAGVPAEIPTSVAQLASNALIKAFFGRWLSVLSLGPTSSSEVGRPARVTFTYRDSLQGAANELRIRVVEGMAHIYPGPSTESRIGFKSCDLFWDFFKLHPKGQ